jgi:hypothetical protein
MQCRPTVRTWGTIARSITAALQRQRHSPSISDLTATEANSGSGTGTPAARTIDPTARCVRRSLTPPRPHSRPRRRPHSRCTAWTRLLARSPRAVAQPRRRPRSPWTPRGLRRLRRRRLARGLCAPVLGWARAAPAGVRERMSLLGLARCVWCGLRRWLLETGARARCLCFSETEDRLHPFPLFFWSLHWSFLDHVPSHVSFYHTIMHTMSPIINCCVSGWKHTFRHKEWKHVESNPHSRV